MMANVGLQRQGEERNHQSHGITDMEGHDNANPWLYVDFVHKIIKHLILFISKRLKLPKGGI